MQSALMHLLLLSVAKCMCWRLQLGLKFPKPGAEAAHQHVIDMNLHPEAALMAAQGHTFPLIIRLETITEDGAKADHSLQVSTFRLQKCTAPQHQCLFGLQSLLKFRMDALAQCMLTLLV